jgi:hypothetical protein
VQKQEVPKTLFGDLIIRNGAKTISLETSFGDLIIIRNGAKTISLQTLFGRLNNNKKRSRKRPSSGFWSKNRAFHSPNFLKNRV